LSIVSFSLLPGLPITSERLPLSLRHTLQRSSEQCSQEKQSLQGCFLGRALFASGTQIFPFSPVILTKGILHSSSHQIIFTLNYQGNAIQGQVNTGARFEWENLKKKIT
jgi:hypothetical protein